MIEAAIHWFLGVLAIPKIGLGAVFIVSFISATLLPLGSEPLVFAVIKADPLIFWSVISVATLGNTLGGSVDYALGYYAKKTFAKEKETVWFRWLAKYGAKTMLLAWLPGIGDPICTLAGWLKLPFWPSLAYMAIGKFFRYITMTYLLLNVPNGFWHWLGGLLG
jgi:membrane protein YqaA with SNARE-associated domain